MIEVGDLPSKMVREGGIVRRRVVLGQAVIDLMAIRSGPSLPYTMTAAQAAKELGVGSRRVRELVRQKKLDGINHRGSRGAVYLDPASVRRMRDHTPADRV